MSCSSTHLEKQIVFRTSRFSRVRNVRCFRSIFCVYVCPQYGVQDRDDDRTRLHHRYRNGECQMGLITLSIVRRLRPDVFPTQRLRRLPFDDQWHARAIAAGFSSQQNSTFRNFSFFHFVDFDENLAWLHPLDRDLVDVLKRGSFFNSAMTVVGLMCSTRAISRIPLPLRVISRICCLTAGMRPW